MADPLSNGVLLIGGRRVGVCFGERVHVSCAFLHPKAAESLLANKDHL